MSYQTKQKIFYTLAAIASASGILFFFLGYTFLIAIAMALSIVVCIWEFFFWKCPHCHRRLNRRDREGKKCPHCKELF